MFHSRLIPTGLAASSILALGAATASGGIAATPDPVTVTVYKTPTCGCCSKWVDHLRAAGFKVVTHDFDDLSETKTMLGVTEDLASCHTAVVDGYVVEGHVPASDIQRMLKERPNIAGITAPGMPMGSPGMEGPRKDAYDVLAFDKQGKTTIFARH